VRRELRILLLLALLALAAFLRLYHLGINPLWYTDESNYVSPAWFLAHGQARYGAILHPYATEILAQPFLFFFLNGWVLRLTQPDIFHARLLSALLAIVAILPLYLIGTNLSSPRLGILAALFFTIHHYSILFTRWGMPYNLSMFFNILALLGMVLYLKDQKTWTLYGAALFAGLSSISSFFGLVTVFFVIGFALYKRPQALWAVIALAVIPFLIFLVWGVSGRGSAFLKDFFALFVQLKSPRHGLTGAADVFARAILNMVSHDFVFLFGVIGLFWWGKAGRLVLAYWLVLILLVLKKQGLDPSLKYNATTHMFCLYFGLAFFVLRCNELLGNALARWLEGMNRTMPVSPHLLAAFLVAIPIIAATGRSVREVATTIHSEYEAVGSVKNISDALALAQVLNPQLKPEDFIVAPERIYWLFHCRTASLYQTVARSVGGTTWHWNLTPERFAFDCSYSKAKFIILDHTDRTIILHPANPNMDLIPRILSEENWKRVHQIGEYQVYLNPRYAQDSATPSSAD
jgi:hypothetical protein